MALGKRQKETLDRIIELCTKPMNEGYMRVEVVIERYRPYTREMGKGHAITVQAIECYPGDEFGSGEYPMTKHWIGNADYEYTAKERGQAFARYLVSGGIEREKVRLLQQ